jgi:hypothetical protein
MPSDGSLGGASFSFWQQLAQMVEFHSTLLAQTEKRLTSYGPNCAIWPCPSLAASVVKKAHSLVSQFLMRRCLLRRNPVCLLQVCLERLASVLNMHPHERFDGPNVPLF